MNNQAINEITTVAACDAALVIARRQRKILVWKITGLELQLERIAEITMELKSWIRDLETTLRFFEEKLQSLPPGDKDLERYTNEKIKTEHKIYVRQQRLKKYPPEKLVIKELELQRLSVSLETQSLGVLQLEAHKVLLQKNDAAATATAEETESIAATPMIAASATEPFLFKIPIGSRTGLRPPTKLSQRVSDA